MPRGRPRKILGDAKAAVIQEEILKENPEGVDNTPKVVKMRHMPEYKTMIFQNRRDPGQPLYFHYASATHPRHQYTLYDGHPAELPIEVIEHLESCADNVYDYGFNPLQERSESYVKARNHHFSFRSVPKGFQKAA